MMPEPKRQTPEDPLPPDAPRDPNEAHEIENPGDPGPNILVPPTAPEPPPEDKMTA